MVEPAGFDLHAAWLRRAEKDNKSFIEALAVRLEQSLPDHVQVERKRESLFSRQMQAHAEADESLEESGVISEPGDTRSKTDRDLDALRAQSGVDAELAKLKGEINPQKQLPGSG